jgi:FKBP-type peptidyl-prolyl cis-trans isomerase 2
MQIAKVGDRVRVQYVRLCSRSRGRPAPAKSLEFIVGSDDVMPGISRGVAGMVQGEQKRMTLQPSDAYGPLQPGLVKEIPRSRFPQRLKLQVGKRLSMGASRRVRVVEIKSDSVVVDGNHALAGKVVELEVTLISVDSSSEANRSQPQYDIGGES